MIRFSTATALGMILATSPALAEITPASVWQELSGYYETMGLTVANTGVEDAGDTLTVRGVTASQSEEGVEFTLALGDVVLSATGDAGVRVDIPDEWTGDVTLTLPPPEPSFAEMMQRLEDEENGIEPAEDDAAPRNVVVNLTIRNPNESITVHQDGTANVYTTVIPTMEMAVSSITNVNGESIANPVDRRRLRR
ncbi:MAG: hypothetical protein Q4G26_00170 [Paracoccus sp. (in: a-proteobacteria)]|nr:hypothetical protein [Paracoccus sp. (in: a-proteobacteria)]